MKVTVLEVDLQRQRISLSMKGDADAEPAAEERALAAHSGGKHQSKQRGGKQQQPAKLPTRSRRVPNTAMGRAFMESLE